MTRRIKQDLNKQLLGCFHKQTANMYFINPSMGICHNTFTEEDMFEIKVNWEEPEIEKNIHLQIPLEEIKSMIKKWEIVE